MSFIIPNGIFNPNNRRYAERGTTMENRYTHVMMVKELASHLVTGMFNITVTYWIHHEMYEEDLTVESLSRDFSDYTVSYITIQHGRMIMGLNNPAR